MNHQCLDFLQSFEGDDCGVYCIAFYAPPLSPMIIYGFYIVDFFFEREKERRIWGQENPSGQKPKTEEGKEEEEEKGLQSHLWRIDEYT